MESDVNLILDERGKRYGTFKGHSEISQGLKELIQVAIDTRGTDLSCDQKEAIEMICHKLARIINGDPNYADSWIDIAGYAKLVADRLNGFER